ncbi:MAG: hypothetical protein IH874_03240 [Candidatus Dadabacteria bacterium]|nr:hypothetical protein [Candidatus Dadabacteria bacterium]
MAKIFYAWQSDLPAETNKDFIRETLEDVVKEINEELSKSSDDFDELELDYDTKNTPGSPPITDIILGKIKGCNIFVSDLSIVGKTDSNKSTPNPNVLIEYGYALRSRGTVISLDGRKAEFPGVIRGYR